MSGYDTQMFRQAYARVTFDRYINLLEKNIIAHCHTQRYSSMQQWKSAVDSYVASESYSLFVGEALVRAGFTGREIWPDDEPMSLHYTLCTAPDNSLVSITLDKDAMWPSHKAMFMMI